MHFWLYTSVQFSSCVWTMHASHSFPLGFLQPIFTSVIVRMLSQLDVVPDLPDVDDDSSYSDFYWTTTTHLHQWCPLFQPTQCWQWGCSRTFPKTQIKDCSYLLLPCFLYIYSRFTFTFLLFSRASYSWHKICCVRNSINTLFDRYIFSENGGTQDFVFTYTTFFSWKEFV